MSVSSRPPLLRALRSGVTPKADAWALPTEQMSTSSDDIVALGGNLEPETLREAYRNGVFPWPADDLPLLWFCPRERAILEFERLHVGRSLARARRLTRRHKERRSSKLSCICKKSLRICVVWMRMTGGNSGLRRNGGIVSCRSRL